ncbi:unnamed protein product [Linum tenue]|uniref:DNA/RNA-binding protein Alba-like domain-containing protein n=1 Tax=Linum tenue TaxID=586396 RepID=A0AAV0RC06_9ROSI|nr:unnamed protein product [Linum tenue]
MDRYQRVEKPKAETPINENEIRITTQGRMRNYISYATALLQEKGSSEIVLKAMGRAINKTVMIAEIIKRRIVGLHQITGIGSTDITDTWEPLEEGLLPYVGMFVDSGDYAACFDDHNHFVEEGARYILYRVNSNPGDHVSFGLRRYQPPLPIEQVKPIMNEIEDDGEGSPMIRGRGRGRARGRGRVNYNSVGDYNDGDGWDGGHSYEVRGQGRARGGRFFRGRGRGRGRGYGGGQQGGGYYDNYGEPETYVPQIRGRGRGRGRERGGGRSSYTRLNGPVQASAA